MRVAVYLPLVSPLLAALAARRLADRLSPRLATWLLTVCAVCLAAASLTALGLLAASGLIRLPVLAALGHLSVRVLRRDDPASVLVAVLAGLALTVAGAAAARMLWRRVRALLAAARQAACLPGSGELVILDDATPDAFAVPGLPGRIVVSTGMLAALDQVEGQVLVAHERAHLTRRHHLFVAAAQLAAAANPLLRPLATSVGYTVERWADEVAVAACGDRRRVAQAVGKAALVSASAQPHGGRAGLAGTLGIGRASSLRAAGPVPRRVAALLAPLPTRRWPVPLVLALLLVTGLCSLDAAQHLHALVELAQGE
jgi:Zn-dependent protease with chaperone function